MSEIKTYQELTAWPKAHALVLAVYSLSKNFPHEELCSFTSQIRRATVSIPSHLAKSFSHLGSRDKIPFDNIAEALTGKPRYQLRLTPDLSPAATSQLQLGASEVKRILRGLIQSIQNKSS